MNKGIYLTLISDVQTCKKNLTDYVDKAVAESYDLGPKSQNEDKCKYRIQYDRIGKFFFRANRKW